MTTINGAPRQGGFSYQPALDGVRGVAVAMVLCFHGGMSWMTGGYVGVSVFFTMSGYLITSLLVAEQQTTGGLSLSAFYLRRIKRLMPASLLCIAAVSAMSAAGLYPAANHLRREAIAATLQIANWNALAQDASYADLVHGSAGPLDHFWSLSVEEQFYWIWPLVFLAMARRSSLWSHRLRLVGAMTAAAIVAAPLIAARWGPDAAYWATPARLAEILTGATLALVLLRWTQRPHWLTWLGWIGAVVIVLAAALLPSDHGLAYEGWLGLGSLFSAALIAGLQATGALRRSLSIFPLVQLGRISYGVYVYHWPIFTLLSPHRTGWHGAPLFLVRIAGTLVAAAVSFVVIEQPIRRRPARFVRSVALAGLATALIALSAALIIPIPVVEFAAPPDLQAQVSIVPAAAPLPEVALDESLTPNRAVRVLVLGDSTAEALSAGMVRWAANNPASMQVSVLAAAGCGLVRSKALFGDGGAMQSRCDQALDADLPAMLSSAVPDVVVVMVTMPDITDRQWTPAEGFLPATDQRYIQRQSADYSALLERLAAAGVTRTVWLASPLPSAAWLGYLNGPIDPASWESQVTATSQAAAESGDFVLLVPFDSWLGAEEALNEISWRPDGLHLSTDAGERIMDRYLAPIVLSAAVVER